jgi:hypothetical protein
MFNGTVSGCPFEGNCASGPTDVTQVTVQDAGAFMWFACAKCLRWKSYFQASRAALTLSALVVLSACVETVDAVRPVDSRVVHFGLTIVNAPAATPDLTSYKIQTFGVGSGDGVFVGWQQREGVLAAPDKCHLAIIIRSDVAAENARQILGMLNGDDVCVANFSRPD